MLTRTAPIEMRFWTKVLPVDSGCWEWQAERDDDGYGRFRSHRRTQAHRYSYEAFIGPVPKGLCVLHRCDNPSCVRPEHLWLGTVAENNSDMAAKGRAKNQHSGKTHCKHGHALTPDNVYASHGKRTCRTCCLAWQRNKRAA